MKKLILLIGIMMLISQQLAWAESERYQYNQDDKLVFDSASGTVYRFVQDGNEINHVVVDYVNGVVKVNGAIQARGTFDYGKSAKELILSNV